jgi:hypothetical protein
MVILGTAQNCSPLTRHVLGKIKISYLLHAYHGSMAKVLYVILALRSAGRFDVWSAAGSTVVVPDRCLFLLADCEQ